MRLLFAIPHYFDPGPAGKRTHGSLGPDPAPRLRAVTACLTNLQQLFGRPQCVIDIAFAPKADLQGRVVDCSKEGLLLAMELSCWSFIGMAKLAEPLMKDGGTLFTMTYYGSQVVVENYNIMGPVKAALESATRYMASELGPKGIRVHAISPGPLKTRAASGLSEFEKLLKKAESKAPSRSLVSIDDVGVAVAFLAMVALGPRQQRNQDREYRKDDERIAHDLAKAPLDFLGRRPGQLVQAIKRSEYHVGYRAL